MPEMKLGIDGARKLKRSLKNRSTAGRNGST